MRILVLSDTHGRLAKFGEIWQKLTDIDHIIHLGDYAADAKDIEAMTGIEVFSVKGNMDGSYTSDDSRVFDTGYGSLFCTHGNAFYVDMGYTNLLYAAEERGCVAVLFGHTHRAVNAEFQGMHVLNPGSLSLPRDGSQGSYGIIEIGPDGYSQSVVYCSPRDQIRGGYLRNLMNYSDRL